MSVKREPRRGTWVVRWREDGRQRARSFTRKGDADRFDAEIKRRQQLGPLHVEQLTARRGATLDEWMAERWSREHAVHLSQATLDRYAQSYELHVHPFIGGAPLAHLGVARLRAWQAERLDAGASPETIRKARTVLSSILTHAAQSEAIPANSLGLVKLPKAEQRDVARALSVAQVERIRAIIGAPMPVPVPVGNRAGAPRAAYDMPDARSQRTRARDALIVTTLAYAGLRPGELRALRFGDIREGTIVIQRATNPNGTIKGTKNTETRSVRLLAPLAQELREYRLLCGRPDDTALVIPRADGAAWTREDWGNWRGRTWNAACARAGLGEIPRPYDLRHSAASLWLAEGRQPIQIARWLGHSLAVLLRTYAHLIDEYADREHVDPEAEIAAARAANTIGMCVQSASPGAADAADAAPGA